MEVGAALRFPQGFLDKSRVPAPQLPLDPHLPSCAHLLLEG